MASLSISRAWEEGSRFAAREFGLLFPIAFMLLALPAILINLLLPPEQSAAFGDMVAWVRRNGIGALIVISLAVALVQLVLNTFGSLAITYLALKPGTSVGESFSVAGRRLLPTVSAALLVALASTVLIAPLWLMMGGPDMQPEQIEAGTALGLLMLMLGAMILFVAVGAKLLPLTAVGAAERLGPIAMIARAWRLTNGHFWRLLGTLILLGLAYLVISAAFAAVFGLLIFGTLGNPEVSRGAAFAASILSGLLTSVTAMFVLPFFARIYAQLSGDPEGTSEVFR